MKHTPRPGDDRLCVSSFVFPSQLSVITCTVEQEVGAKLVYDLDGKVISQEPVSRGVCVEGNSRLHYTLSPRAF